MAEVMKVYTLDVDAIVGELHRIRQDADHLRVTGEFREPEAPFCDVGADLMKAFEAAGFGGDRSGYYTSASVAVLMALTKSGHLNLCYESPVL